MKRRVNANFCNTDSAGSEICGHKLVVKNSDQNGWITRYCARIPDGEHMVNTVVMWTADHGFGFYKNKFGICNALQNFSKEFFKCVENNEEVTIAMLKYYSKNTYQRVHGAAATRFMGLRDSIDDMYHFRRQIKPKRKSQALQGNDENKNDCETNHDRMRNIFQYCMIVNSTLHKIDNDILLDRNISRADDHNDDSDVDSNHSSDMELALELVLESTPTANPNHNNQNDNVTTENSSHSINDNVNENNSNMNVNADLTMENNESKKSKLPIKIDPKSLFDKNSMETRDTDFKKFTLYATNLIEYVKKHKINKKVYFDTIGTLKSIRNHCSMIVFNNSITFGLFPLNSFLQSNYSRFNGMISKLCKTFRNIKILKLSLIQQINQIDPKLWKEVVKVYFSDKKWYKWLDRTTCMITVASGSKTFPECGKHPNINHQEWVCDQHCQTFDDNEQNMDAIKRQLSPCLTKFKANLEYVEYFCEDLLVDFKISNSLMIVKYIYQDWFDYRESDVYKQFELIEGYSNAFMEAYFYLAAIVQVDWMYYKCIERFKQYFDPPLIILSIADLHHGREHADIIVNKIGFTKLIEDVAKYLSFENSDDLLNSLRNDGIFMFETHLGWIWSFLRREITEFANNNKFTNLEDYRVDTYGAAVLRMWIAAMCSQVTETMRIETVNKTISDAPSQQSSFGKSMKNGLLSGINYQRCLTPSPMRYDINVKQNIHNKKFTRIPGNTDDSWNAFLTDIDDDKYQKTRRSKAALKKLDTTNIQLWRNSLHCNNDAFSVDNSIHTISEYNQELQDKQAEAERKRKEKQIKEHKKKQNIHHNNSNPSQSSIASTDPEMIAILNQKKRKKKKQNVSINHESDDLAVVGNGFKSDNNEELDQSAIDAVLNLNNVQLLNGINIVKRNNQNNDEKVDDSDEKKRNENEIDSNVQANVGGEYLQELMAEETETLLEDIIPGNMSEVDRERNEFDRLNRQIATGSENCNKWNNYEKSLFIQNMFWLIKHALDEETKVNETIDYFKHCVTKMYGFNADSLTQSKIIAVVNSYYQKWDEFIDIDEDQTQAITLQYVQALQSQDVRSRNVVDKHIKAKVQQSLERFDLSTFKDYLYDQNKITFNAATQNAIQEQKSSLKRQNSDCSFVSRSELLHDHKKTSLNELTCFQLKKELKKRGISTSGKKSVLVEKLEQYFDDTDGDDNQNPPKKRQRLIKR